MTHFFGYLSERCVALLHYQPGHQPGGMRVSLSLALLVSATAAAPAPNATSVEVMPGRASAQPDTAQPQVAVAAV